MKRKKKSVVITAVVAAVLILAFAGWKIYWTYDYYKYQLPQKDKWKDAHPTKKQVDKWLLKDFDPADYKIWNKNPKLEGLDFDTDITQNQEIYLIPFGENDWSARCFVWKWEEQNKLASIHPVQKCRVIKNRNAINLYVNHHKRNEYGVGAIIQGWAHEYYPPLNQYLPPPIKTANKHLVLSFDLKIDQANVQRFNPASWQFIGINLRLGSVDLPKRIVMDLMIYSTGRTLHTESVANIYRYAKVITRDQKESFGKWHHYDVNISALIADMLKRFGIQRAAPSLKLYSLEILSETMYGECGFWTKNIYLYHKEKQR
jgi:hypothetical protein